jgi:hypothetical protein
MTQLEKEADAHAAAHDPDCKWKNCYTRMIRRESFLAGAASAEKRITELEGALRGEHSGCNYLATPMFCNKCGYLSTKGGA